MDDNELINGILKEFKMLNSISNVLNDDLYKLYIKKSIQTILNLTNRYVFPNELRYVVLDLINELYNDNGFIKSVTNNETTQSIKSISEEGRQVTFGNASESTVNSLLSSYISNRLDIRKQEINRYKLLYKVKGV